MLGAAAAEHTHTHRAELLCSVRLRQNPHNVHEWHKRVKIFEDRDAPDKAHSIMLCYVVLYCIVLYWEAGYDERRRRAMPKEQDQAPPPALGRTPPGGPRSCASASSLSVSPGVLAVCLCRGEC